MNYFSFLFFFNFFFLVILSTPKSSLCNLFPKKKTFFFSSVSNFSMFFPLSAAILTKTYCQSNLFLSVLQYSPKPQWNKTEKSNTDALIFFLPFFQTTFNLLTFYLFFSFRICHRYASRDHLSLTEIKNVFSIYVISFSSFGWLLDLKKKICFCLKEEGPQTKMP